MNPEELQKIQELQKKYGLSGGNFSEPQSEIQSDVALVQSRRKAIKGNKGFIADLKGIGTGIKEDLTKRGENIEEISTLEKQGQGTGTSLFQKFGQVAGGVSDVIGQTFMGGVKALTPQPIQEAVGETVQTGVEKVVDTDIAQSIIQKYQNADPTTQKNIDALLGIGSLATDVLGAGLAKKPVTQAVKKGIETGGDVIQATGRAIEPVTNIAKGTVAGVQNLGQKVADVPSRIGANLAEQTAKRADIKSLNNPVVQKAAREGIEVTDLQTVRQIPRAERPALKKLADTVKNFADGKTKVSPFEVVGTPIVKRLKTLDNQVKGFSRQLDSVAEGLKGQPINNMGSVWQTVSDGLNRLKVGVADDGKLNFTGSQLEGLGKSGDVVSNVFNRINRANDASDLHILKKFIDENVSYGKRVEGLSGEAEKLLKEWRRTIDAILDAQFPSYNKVNTELSKRIQPLNDLKDLLKNADGLDSDLLSQKAGILARRITSASPSNPEIKQILRNLDKLTGKKGQTLLSTERLQDFYNILNKYYDIAPKTGFQNLVKEGVEGGTTAIGLVTAPAKKLVGQTDAVRRKAFEDALTELFK